MTPDYASERLPLDGKRPLWAPVATTRAKCIALSPGKDKGSGVSRPLTNVLPVLGGEVIKTSLAIARELLHGLGKAV